MATFIDVTDSLTGEPVAVNIDRIETMRTRNTGDGPTTIIDFGKNFVQCRESMGHIASLMLRAMHS